MDTHEISTDAALDSCTESQYNVLDATVSSEQRRGMARPKTAESFSCAQTATSSQHNTSHSSIKPFQTAQPMDSHDNSNYLHFLQFFPEHLKEDNIDILIINAHNDQDAAEEFKKHLANDIIVYVNKTSLRPRVKRLDEFVKGSSHEHLDFAFEKTLYVFLFVTKEFCDCTWTLLQGQACLTQAIHDPDKKWCVIPVHTKSRRNMNYKLPMMLGSLRPINYWKDNADQFYTECVRKLIESKLSLLVERDQQLDQKRRAYFLQNQDNIVKKYYDLQSRLTKTHKIPISIGVAKESEPMSYCVENTPGQIDYTSRLEQLALNSVETSTNKDSQQHTLQPLQEHENVDVSLSNLQNSSTELVDEGFSSISMGSKHFVNSSSECMTSSISVDGPPGVNQCNNLSVPPCVAQSNNYSMPSNDNSITVDGPPSVTQCKHVSMPSNNNSITVDSPPCGEVSESRSLKTHLVYPNYPIHSSVPTNFSSSCIMGPNGIMYTSTPYGYLPVLPPNQYMNSNACQNVTFSHGSSLPGPPSQNSPSSLNSSMQPNVSEPSISHQMPNAPFSFVPFNPLYSGYYMPSFPPLVTGHVNPSLIQSQGIWSHPYHPNQQPQEMSGQPNRFPLDDGQSTASSRDQRASYHSQRSGQVDGAEDAQYHPNSSSGSVQHIHHHYNQEIKIESATNVVIGKKAKVINTLESSAESVKSDNLSGSNSGENEDFIIGNIDSSQNTQTDTSRLGQSVPSADCNQESSKSPLQSSKKFMGFPECLDPCSVPHSAENPNSQMNLNSDETTPKKII